MQFDDILKEVGEFGKFQKIKYGLLCLLAITNAFQALISVFSIYTPKHRYDNYLTHVNQSMVCTCGLAWPGFIAKGPQVHSMGQVSTKKYTMLKSFQIL